MKSLFSRWTDRPLRSKSLVIIALPLAVLLISELVSFSVTPAEGGASGFVIAVAVR